MTHPSTADPDNDPHPAFGPDLDPINPSPTAELTALTAKLSRLTARFADLDFRTTALSKTLNGRVLPELAQLRATTADQITQLQQILDTIAHPGGAADWATMDAEHAAAAWQDLAHWIEHTLVPWHEITRDQLPDCWAMHRPAVTELAWLGCIALTKPPTNPTRNHT